MQTVIGAFDDRQTAQRAVERLVEAGFDRDDVHVEHGRDSTQATSQAPSQTSTGTSDDEDRGFFASIGHFFASIFGEDQPSERTAVYSEAVRRGSSIVVVDAQDEDRADRASQLLQELGAIDVDERSQQWRQEGWTGQMDDQPRMATNAPTGTTQQSMGTADQAGREKLDVVQEEIQVGKRAVERGGVRVFQRISEKPVRELVRLREERAVVERTPVDREATAADLSNFKEGTVEVRETVEEPVVAKRARVVEEVRVGKEVSEREETINDTVRRKDVEVQRLEGSREDRALASESDMSNTNTDTDTTRDPDMTSTPKTGTRTRVKKDKPGT